METKIDNLTHLLEGFIVSTNKRFEALEEKLEKRIEEEVNKFAIICYKQFDRIDTQFIELEARLSQKIDDLGSKISPYNYLDEGDRDEN